MLDIARLWAEGWAVSRGTPRPVDEPWGLRIEVGQPTQLVRHVLLGGDTEADAAVVRRLIGTITEPTTCIKGFLSPSEMEPWFPAGWEPLDPCFLMAVDLRPSRVQAPEGYAVTAETAGGLTHVRVHSATGDLAAAGQLGVTGTAGVFDQIVTEPAHQRRGLGTVVMGTLTSAAVENGAATGILGATVQGRALYAALGWKVLAPLTGFVYKPVAS
ncbi:GNAT family N-acetyltransferase [Hamadaea sp. NPDC051192]|uniref:GNAT family N-acetyltransferase n=1 Tax=Hamadaea sp. NPDC051192 TaxID=3154940 RepID=UPI0034138066